MANIAPEFSPVVSSQSYQVVPEELYTQPETTTVDLEDDIKFGGQGMVPSFSVPKQLSPDKKAEMNLSYDPDQYYLDQEDEMFAEYSREFDAAMADDDPKGAEEWNTWWDYQKSRRTKYEESFNCTFGVGGCSNESLNIFKNEAAEWNYDDVANNVPLLKSLRRTYGSVDNYGNELSDQDLIDRWMTEQTYVENNLSNLGYEAATLKGATDQQKEDFALQMLTYGKIKATGEGSRETWDQTRDVMGALITDITNWGVLGTFGFAGIAKEGAKTLTKKGLKQYLSNFVKSKTAKTGAATAGIGATYTGLYNLGRQSIKIQADLQNDVNWGEAAVHSGLGGALGGTLGVLIGGGSAAFNRLADRHIRKTNGSNTEFLKNLRENVKTEADLNRWLKDIGWSKKEALEEIKHLEEQGYKFDPEKNSWVTKEGQEYKPSLDVRGTEEAHFGAQVTERVVPRPVARQADEVLDKEYVDVQNIDMPIPFSKLGQRAFDWLDNSIGNRAMRTIYGGDAIMIRSGLRKEATAINDAMAATDINVSRISQDLKNFVSKHEKDIGDINNLIRTRVATTEAQKKFLKKLDDFKNNQLRLALRNKVISKKDYLKFLKDPSYIPRVWNSQHLLTDEGSKEFSEFVARMWKMDKEGARTVINHITRKKEDTDELINAGFAPSKIREAFRKKADREIDTHRSTHLEHERQIKIPEKYENLLDPFMAQPIDRWSKFFEDTIRRNEFARRFGKNDKLIHDKIKNLKNSGRGRAAEHLREYYFTTMGDPKHSETLKAKMEAPRLMRGISKINAFQNLKLGLAAIPNATQSFVNGAAKLARSGSLLTAPFKAMSAIIRANVKTTRDMDIIHRAGVLGETDLARIATENLPHSRIVEKEFTKGLQYLNEPTKFLRAVGFIGVEEMNRRAAAIMAHGHVASLHSKLQKLMLKGKSTSVKARRFEKELKELGISDPHKAELSARDYSISGHVFNKHVNFSGETFNIPSNWQTPWFKLFTKFKSFMFHQARFLKRNVADELFINHNPKPLIAYLGAAGVAGNMAELTRALATGKEIEANREPLELLISGVGNAGGAGLWFDTMQQVGERGPAGAWGSIMGPTLSDTAYTAQDLTQGDIDKIIGRMLPNVPGKRQMVESWRDQ